MLGILNNLVKNLFESLFYIMREMWRQLAIMAATAWAWAMAACALVMWVVDVVNEGLESIVGYLDYFLSMSFPGLPSQTSISHMYALGNTLFPLDALILFLASWAALIGVLSIYKVIKTWIPTLS